MSSASNSSLNIANLINLTGKVALITGGGTGIGLMIAKGLASNGAKVYISGRRIEVVQKAATDHHFDGTGSLVPLRMDVTDKSSIKEAAKNIQETDGRLDILVNNAGTDGPIYPGWSAQPEQTPNIEAISAYGEQLFEQSIELWDAVARTNVASVFFVTTAFLGLLAKSAEANGGQYASVINISSGFAFTRLNFGSYAYDCSKAAVSHLSKLLATDLLLKRAPIRVNTISPGTFASELTATDAQLRVALQHNFLGSLVPNPMRRPGREEEIAGLAVYLASPVSEYVQGADIGIEGGFCIVNP
ncbi:hypothetical protein ACEPAG_4535 [Sanghuangporus baumii]